MIKVLLDNIAGIAGETIKLLIIIVTGVVLLDRVKNATRELNTRVAALEQWRDDHISSIQPHTVCILEDRRKVDEREWLERIERKIDRLEMDRKFKLPDCRCPSRQGLWQGGPPASDIGALCKPGS